VNKIYAKIYYQDGKPVSETLEEHTKNLIKNLEMLKNLYGKEINLDHQFWENLKLACLFHDLGKVSSHFQKKIRKILKEKENIPKGLNKEIPHNFLSGVFLYTRELRRKIQREWFDYIFYSVVFHHDRDINFSKDYLQKVIQNDLSKKIQYLDWLKNYGINLKNLDNVKAGIVLGSIQQFNNRANKIPELRKEKTFIMLKGLLHRLDHSASAHLPVEVERIKNTEEYLINYLKNIKKAQGLKNFQKKAKDLRDKNILLTASTGMGKTEFAINWIGDDKAFYTLPVRVSVNAMYERFLNIFGEKNKDKIGLLHSDAIFYGIDELKKEEDKQSIEEHILRTQTSRQLSLPITITTADQLFTSVLKYNGYEKIYSTLIYSKVIIDEPQSYSPDTLAIIIKGLQEISNYGGKFCLMSATIHPFIRKHLRECSNLEELEPVFSKEKKHKIKLIDEEINSKNFLNYVLELYNANKKILVIVNTVKKSQQVYKKLKEIFPDMDIKLLHSLFIQKDRVEKEEDIKNDFKKDKPVIWITTQLVEASLDIDYDVLFTEIATLDALIQRMGRVYRRKGRTIQEEENPNIYILTKNPSDKGKIYNTEIVNLTRQALQKYDEQILLDEYKQNLIEEVFDINKIKETTFYKKFKKNLDILEYGYEADNKSEAQKIFREILNITVIPEKIYSKNSEKIENIISKILSKNTPKEEILLNIKELNSFTLSLPIFRLKDEYPTKITPKNIKQTIYLVNFDYDSEIGLRLDKEKDNFEFL